MEGQQTRRRLGDLLVDGGVLSQAQLGELLRSRINVDGRLERLGEAAVRMGYATVDEIGMVLAQQLDLDYMDDQVLSVDPELARRVPAALVERHLVVPLWREQDIVTVACADPTNIIGLDDVRVAVGARRLNVVVAPLVALHQAIRDSFGLEFDTEGLVEALKDDDELDDDLLADAASDGPIIRLADEIITTAVRSRASDVHIEPKPDRCVVRHRVDGVLHEAMSLPRNVAGPLISRIKLIAGLDIAERRKPQDGRSHFKGAAGHPEEAVDLRLSTLPSMFGESVVIRLLRRDDSRHQMADIGLDPAQTAQVLSVVERPQGLVLVTGPTGSGKTSTLYSLLAHMATVDRKLITVEDPVEYELEGIVQTQVNERAGYTLTRALRAMLRQDPDVVMVGEIRDPETAELALQASLTGHLVLSTLHTNDAPSAVVRLGELGMPGYLVASSLAMVIAQRLVRRVCPSCATPAVPTDRQRQRLALRADADGFVEGRGCSACHHTGYLDRQGAFEILTVDSGVRELIADGSSTAAIGQMARQNGMRSLREDALHKAASGMTTLEEVLRVTPSPEHAQDHCPVCAKQIEPDFAACPWCAADLRPFRCGTCERSLDVAWVACPTCGTAVPHGEVDRGSLPTVLVVDDDPHVCDALKAMLTGDFDVVAARTGEEALASIHTAHFDAVVLDKGLPDMDGYQVTREIRSRPTVRDIPVLIITGHDDPEVEMEGLRAGADDWIAKPVDLEVLVARLTRLVTRRIPVA
ncbi:MAG TPA: ATPase, T2SS/T4P/T4SS family [Euzebya sp.]|nr:ATPase, T2SS/T4P/T4SS family [Euzebya sp.]